MITYELTLLLRVMPKQREADRLKVGFLEGVLETHIELTSIAVKEIEQLQDIKEFTYTRVQSYLSKEFQTSSRYARSFQLMLIKEKTDLKAVLKRAASAIFDKGGVIRKIDNLGTQKMPYKTTSHGAVHREASYFVFSFTVPPTKIDSLLEEYHRDIDIIRNRIYKENVEQDLSCTLEEELKPAPYRSEVIKMIEQGKKKQAKLPKFKYNTGLSYYPFQK